MSMSYVLLAIAVAILIGCAVWAGGRRRKALEAWAAAHGLAFHPGRDRRFDSRFGSFGCLKRGHSRCAYHIAEGRWGERQVMAFDYRYVTGSGKNQQTHTFSSVILESNVPLQQLRIRSETVFDRVGEFFGVDDIDFESAAFSRAFHVQAQSKRWAYDVLHQRTMEFLLASPRFSIEFDERNAIAWREHRFDVEAFEAAIGVLEGILERLPEYVIRREREGKELK